MDVDDVAEEAAKPDKPAGEQKEAAAEGQRQGRPAPRMAEVAEEEADAAENAEESERWKEAGGEGEEGDAAGTHVGPLRPEGERGGVEVEGAAGADEMEAEAEAEAEEATATLEGLQAGLEEEMAQWQLQGDAASAEAVWRAYEARTGGLAQELCEQLRLILEATVASKLQGDYRTGKRISMRK
eukprot:3677166-Prymnesium_polylepis.1